MPKSIPPWVGLEGVGPEMDRSTRRDPAHVAIMQARLRGDREEVVRLMMGQGASREAVEEFLDRYGQVGGQIGKRSFGREAK